MKNNNNITAKCTMSPYEKYNTTLSSLYFFFLKHNFYSFSLSFLIGILFFGIPCLFSYTLYLSGKLESMFSPILLSLYVLLFLFFSYLLFKIYLAATSREFIPPWERDNIGSTVHGIVILVFILLFCKKCNFCLNENISVESSEQNSKVVVSSFQKFIFVLIINGNYHENENIEKSARYEVFNIEDDKNKVIVKVLMNIFNFVISPLIYLSFYLLIKLIFIKTKYSFEKFLLSLCVFFEYFDINKTNKITQINFIVFISLLIEIAIRKLYKISKNHPPKPFTTNTSEEIYSFFDYILLFFFQLLLICSYIFFIFSYYYIIYLGREDNVIKGKLIFNLGVFLLFLGNCFIFGNSLCQMIFSPVKKSSTPSKMKAHYIQVKYLRPIIQGGIQAESDEETANLLSYN